MGRQFLLTENQDLGAEVQYSSANDRWKGFQLKGSGIIVGSCGFGTSLIQRYSTCENYSQVANGPCSSEQDSTTWKRCLRAPEPEIERLPIPRHHAVQFDQVTSAAKQSRPRGDLLPGIFRTFSSKRILKYTLSIYSLDYPSS